MTLNNPGSLSCQNIVSFDANKTPNITAVSGCNIGCRFCKCLVIKLICGMTGSLCFAERCAITNPPGFSSHLAGCKKSSLKGCFFAERQGFEPWVPVRVQRFSRPSRSTTPASFLGFCTAKVQKFFVMAKFFQQFR